MSSIQVIYTDASPNFANIWTEFGHERRVLEKGWVRETGRRPLPVSMIWEKDVSIKLRDVITLYGDVFRPMDSDDKPVPAILPWSPYGKTGTGNQTLDMMPWRVGIPKDMTSGLEKFEAPDPAEWIQRGYAIVNVDARGAFHSEGDIQHWNTQEGRDGYDTIEWIAEQKWCNGSVGLAGNSWLGVTQWLIAAEQPPHLKAIAPWEGLSDLFKQSLCRGGIPNLPFWDFVGYVIARRKNGTTITNPRMLMISSSFWTGTSRTSGDVQYNAELRPGPGAKFVYKFSKYTELCGFSKAHLFMSAPNHDDMDVFVVIRKLDKYGVSLEHFNIPIKDLPEGTEPDQIPKSNIFRYVGPNGCLRASRRYREEEPGLTASQRALLSPAYVYHPLDREEKISPGQVVELEIGIWPGGMIFDSDESLSFEIKGFFAIRPEFENLLDMMENHNKGTQRVHCGGEYPSSLLVALSS
ncbi:CocE/NonD hydrolase [Curvularia clavata]|uniref:CocE/NonD hydrolase n=1 Tax=Curvularia clavata TaxID=95742 RepID=A0A9Q8ZDV7_CURCL|nr:CocE/NonD hydrolase [Curvularia clavata]